MARPAPAPPIPAYALYGEHRDFPDVLHCEEIWDRAHRYDWVIAPHRHPALDQVFFITDGGGWVELDGARRPLAPPCAIWAPRRVVHGFRFVEGTRGHVVSIPSAEVAAMAAEEPELAAFARGARVLAGSGELRAAVEALHREWRAAAPLRAPLLRALARALVARLARAAADAGRAPGAVEARMEAFEALARERMAQDWKVADYARALGYSATHLGRLTRAHAGQSPAAFLTALRMQEARRLLAYTLMDVAEVGYRLGYEDPSYFSRAFRRETGLSPSDFRAPYRAEG
ncbi:helix-turn-helix domain-containing protein [Albimonas sp. CAU 1670]|uniref:helix-turn-helix domain-containing protein n=1 Tax=Albimonas sp. CAU 1670 TaxID=3032599 RepID=UPI0023DB41E5|nr:helix-turn-helix domain-containing protein [Albimonas sp. CAU 1670]MDF2232611.1 helix-turn-helix domain-containing protein [Albimonas sp. CAU 1670]